jgi:RND family efflux transporter MFP subunit
MNRLTTALMITAISAIAAQPAFAQSEDTAIEGFIEPFRKIELSSDETGAIASMMVEEGDLVQQNEVIAKLDSRVQEIQLEIATKVADSVNQQRAAGNTLKKRRAISRRLDQLQQQGHASESEIIRADLEMAIAEANYFNAVEEAAVREIEMRRAKIQLEKRTIRAPFNGFIATIARREGEFLSPLHPEVCTLIQVDKLLASFNVNSESASDFHVGQQHDIRLSDGTTIQATVHSVGVEINPQSGTVEIKFVIDNHDYKIRSGDNCSLNV